VSQLNTLRNIGTEMERKLRSVGIDTAEELIQTGSKDAYVRLKLRYPNVCLVHLYVLQGAIDGIPYNHLPADVKRDLKMFSDRLK